MSLYRTLANDLLGAHPEEAAQVLESLPKEDALSVLADAPAAVAAVTVGHMAPHRAADVLATLECSRAAPIVEALGPALAASVLRRMEVGERDALVSSLTGDFARSLSSLLRFPEGTAGSFMDPHVLALPGDLTVEQSVDHIREHPEHVRYNLYVVDREQVLVGVLNLRELLLAAPGALLSAIALPGVLSIRAAADRHAVLTHPAWRDMRSVPVVDERGVYLGALRYRTLRQLEEELREGESDSSAPTVAALGELFSAGISSVFVALATSVAKPLPGSVKRD